jgi:hypothetical protein
MSVFCLMSGSIRRYPHNLSYLIKKKSMMAVHKHHGSLFFVSALMILMCSLLVACFNDDFDRDMNIEALPLDILVLDKNTPVPGNDGLITNNLVTDTSIQILWTAATDIETAQDGLMYCLYRSEANNISTPSDAVKHGTVVNGCDPGVVTFIDTGLDPGTTYFYNVVVQDGDGLKAAYRTVSITTLADAIFMFPEGTLRQGNLASSSPTARTEIDALCMNARLHDYPAVPCLNVRGFISIDAADDIAGMPGNYGVPTGRKIVGPEKMAGPAGDMSYPAVALNWVDLLDGTIGMTLTEGGITSDPWWSGSLADGSYDDSVENCGGWTSPSAGSRGRSGKADKADDSWIAGNSPGCNASRVVLCVCW